MSESNQVNPALLSARGVRAVMPGLSKREHFAAMAMQAVFNDCVKVMHAQTPQEALRSVAILAVAMADALLAELARTEEATP